MSASFAEAWQGAEAKMLAHFIEKLDSVEKGPDANAIEVEKFPRAFPKDEDVHIYTFEIHGPGEMVPASAPGRPFCAWKMDATLMGLFTKRKTGQAFAGLVVDSLPFKDPGQGITHLEHTENPSLVRDVIILKEDQSTGGQVRIWRLTVPMLAVFTAKAGEEE